MARFGRASSVRWRAPVDVPCCSARNTPDTTKTHLRRWSRGGRTAVASRDRKRRWAAIGRRRRTAEAARDGQNAAPPVPMSCLQFAVSSCIGGFETRSSPVNIRTRLDTTVSLYFKFSKTFYKQEIMVQ